MKEQRKIWLCVIGAFILIIADIFWLPPTAENNGFALAGVILLAVIMGWYGGILKEREKRK